MARRRRSRCVRSTFSAASTSLCETSTGTLNIAWLRDSYVNDYLHRKAAGDLNMDFSTDDMVLGLSIAACAAVISAEVREDPAENVKRVQTMM